MPIAFRLIFVFRLSETKKRWIKISAFSAKLTIKSRVSAPFNSINTVPVKLAPNSSSTKEASLITRCLNLKELLKTVLIFSKLFMLFI